MVLLFWGFDFLEKGFWRERKRGVLWRKMGVAWARYLARAFVVWQELPGCRLPFMAWDVF